MTLAGNRLPRRLRPAAQAVLACLFLGGTILLGLLLAPATSAALGKPMGRLASGTAAVSTAATIIGHPHGGCNISVTNMSATPVYLGDSAVTTSTGTPICTDSGSCPSPFATIDAANGLLFGIVSAGSVTVRFLAGGGC